MLFPADFTEQTWADIEQAVDRWLAWFRAGPKVFYKDVRTADVMTALRGGDIELVLVGGYLIGYDLGSPWFAPEKVFLQELTAFRVDPTPRSFRVVPETLLRIAAAIPNCAGVSVGTSFTRDDRLLRVYQRYGFQVEAQSLFRSTHG